METTKNERPAARPRRGINWGRVGCVAGSLVLGAIAAAVPPTSVILLPVVGALSVQAGLGALAVGLGGVAVKTPGFVRGSKKPRP